MSALAGLFGVDPEPNPLRDAFLRWQCRVRQMAMREDMGRPGAAVSPFVTLRGDSAPLGQIITVLSKMPAHSLIPEFKHMVKRTFDPAQRRDKAIELFSETYYQKARTFSDILTSVFTQGSEGAARIRRAEHCTLHFNAYGQQFDLICKTWRLAPKNPYYQSTWWHNHLFNPDLSKEAIILGFEPDWDASSATPPVVRG